MKTRLLILLLCLSSLSVMGQGVVQGTITRNKCKTCGKVISQCQYKGKHPAPKPVEEKCKTCGKVISKCQYKGKHPVPKPVEEKCKTCGKVISKCQYKGNHPAQQPVEAKCKTCGKALSKCQYGGYHPKCTECGKLVENCEYHGKHPAPEAAGYDVSISCNVPTATLYIDGTANGTASGTRFLKTGSHSVKLTADGYESLTRNVTVSSSSRSFSFTMTRQAAPALYNQTITANGVSFTMIAVQGGTFTMGGTSEQGSDAYYDEKPTHSVTLGSYYIGETEVAQALWTAVMGSNPSNWKGDNLPVEQVSWNDCQTFISKLNSLTGKRFRLPTEAEWEYAARGGSKSRGYKYSGSNSIGDVAWYTDNSGNKTHAVKTRQPNELGLYDMSGNVNEWCSDWYGNYSSNAQTNPIGANSGSGRVICGGCWGNDARLCRVSDRGSHAPGRRSNGIGFRLALSQ